MNFRPELAEAVVAGRKTVTRRRIAVCPGRGKVRIGSAAVAAVERENFSPAEITYLEARREGFDSVLAFIETWINLHDEAKPIDVWRIELAEPASNPSISTSREG